MCLSQFVIPVHVPWCSALLLSGSTLISCFLIRIQYSLLWSFAAEFTEFLLHCRLPTPTAGITADSFSITNIWNSMCHFNDCTVSVCSRSVCSYQPCSAGKVPRENFAEDTQRKPKFKFNGGGRKKGLNTFSCYLQAQPFLQVTTRLQFRPVVMSLNIFFLNLMRKTKEERGVATSK